MLSNIHLKGFQCHKDTKLKLDSITILTGENDVGKSAIIRALLWLSLNEWDGRVEDIINWEMDECSVEIVLDSNIISRHKGSENKFILNDIEYKAFGSKIPDKVKDALNLCEGNFQLQHQPAFWLTLSNSDAARSLNEIFHLSVIDESFSNIASQLRETKSCVNVSQERLESIRKQRKELAWVKEANFQLKELEYLEIQILQEKDESMKLTSVLERIEKSDLEQAQMEETLTIGEETLAAGETLLELDKEIQTLQQILRLEDALCQLEKNLEIKEEKLSKLLKGRCPLCGRAPVRS